MICGTLTLVEDLDLRGGTFTVVDTQAWATEEPLTEEHAPVEVEMILFNWLVALPEEWECDFMVDQVNNREIAMIHASGKRGAIIHMMPGTLADAQALIDRNRS